MTLTYDGVTERSKDADVLVLRLSDGQTALPVFGREE